MSNAMALPRRAFDRLWRSRFARNVAVVASGTAGAQAITIAFAPLITRIYGPEAFGLLGTFMAIVAVAIPVAALAYPIAIVLPREDRDALGLVRLSAILSFGVALLAAALLAFGGDWLTVTLGAESVAGYLFLIPVAMLFAAWMQIAQQWLIRKKQFGVVARSAVAHSLILNSAKSGIGWLHPVGAVLIVLATLGHALHAALLFIGARRRYQAEAAEGVDGSHTPLRELAHRHRDFPLYRAPQNFINAASQSLPVLMLAAFFGPVAAGFYTLAKMVMGMPTTLIGKAVNDVFYPRITEAAHNGENLPRHIVQATGALLAIGIVPFGLVVVFGPWFFGLVFGVDWVMAGEYARWLALFFLFNFINKPAVAAVPVLGIQRGLLVYELFSTGAKALGLVVGFYWFGSDLWAVALFSVIGVLAYSAMMLWILSHAMRWRTDAKTS
ncbi:lipopolysaccharide biosynthesis protein [Thioalkalivibrio sp. K90mix]|uniref:lipopolysaccharide biosynthesis protein n=1 Tax=Thioalkalivibrio sp. (strain K90mix) TaxID=396595 RepID=UPI001FCB71E1|nr:lipopolysaccharide biosynthesis protein [Thioalkalivibrio sp. K90mix]